ncbi:25943_t:CDS:2, partial [Racocetra persica]
MTVVIAFFSYFAFSNFPENATWLSEDERKLAIDRLRLDMGEANTTHFDKSQIFQAFRDLKIYIFMFINLCILVSLYSFGFFIPSIVNGLGFNTVISQLLSTPPSIFGCISSIMIAILSDRHGVRGPYLVSCLLVSIIGYILLIVPSVSVSLKYTGACIVGLGMSACVPTSLTWLTNNLAGDSKRAVGCAMMIAWGNIGGAISAQLYKSDDAPAYKTGHTIAMSFVVIAVILSIIQYYLFNNANKSKLKDSENFLKKLNGEDVKHLGDLHPSFIY